MSTIYLAYVQMSHGDTIKFVLEEINLYISLIKIIPQTQFHIVDEMKLSLGMILIRLIYILIYELITSVLHNMLLSF